MFVATSVTFEYEALTGSYTIQGPVLKFRVKAEHAASVNAPIYIRL